MTLFGADYDLQLTATAVIKQVYFMDTNVISGFVVGSYP